MTTSCTDCDGAGFGLAQDEDDHGTHERRVPCETCSATGELADCRHCAEPIAACDDYCTDCLAEEDRRSLDADVRWCREGF